MRLLDRIIFLGVALFGITQTHVQYPARAEASDDRWPTATTVDPVETTLGELAAPGAAVAVVRRQQTWQQAFGFADDQRQRVMPADARMRLGSVTKLYLAAVVLQLVDEGVLDLDEPIGRYVAGVPNGQRITLRMLGRHTSGLDDAIRQMPFHERLAGDPGRAWPTDELLRVAFEPGPRFEPGERWAYSNTNSILLGIAVKQATGRSWREHVRERFLEPLGLDDTGFDEPPTVRGFRYGKREDPVGYGDEQNHQWFDATDWSASWAGAAGEMSGTAADTAKFIHALFGGDLLSEAMQAELTDLKDTGDGDFLYGFHCHALGRELGIKALGHSGDVPGFSSSAAWLPESRTAVVVLTNLSAELDKWGSASKLMDVVLADLAGSASVANAPAAPEGPIDSATKVVAMNEAMNERFAAELRRAFDSTAIRGAQVALIESGQVSTLRLGEADKRFRAGSVSKLLTSLLVLRAVEAGVLGLDDPVVRWLPGVFGDADGAERVTIAQLLEHTAGVGGSGPSEYAAEEPGLDPTEYVKSRQPFAMRWRPGLHYSYSNPGYTIAAAAVAQAWDADFDTLMRREVLAPLGMDQTTFDAPSPPSFLDDAVTPAEAWRMPVRPAGAAVTTASDLGRVVAMLLTNGGQFLDSDSVARLERGGTGILASAGGGEGAYGLGTFAYVHENHVLRGHWGKTEGFRATLAYTPQMVRHDASADPRSKTQAAPRAGYVLLVDTADDAGVSRLRSLLNHRVTRSLPGSNEPATGPGPLPEIYAGWYVNATSDMPQRAWLMGLLGVRHLSPTDRGVRVSPLFFGSASTWRRVGDNLYQAEGLPVASGATWTGPEGRFWIDGESYRLRPAWIIFGQIAVLTLGLIAATVAVLSWPVIMLLRWRQRLQHHHRTTDATRTVPTAGRLCLHALALAGFALIYLLLGFTYLNLGDLSTVAQLGQFNAVTFTFIVASLLGPVTVTLLVICLLRSRPFPYHRARLLWAVPQCVMLLAAFALLTAFGMIPFWPA